MVHLANRRIALWSGAACGAVALLGMVIWLRTRWPRVSPGRPALLHSNIEPQRNATPASYTVIIAPRSSTGSATEAGTPRGLKPVIQVESPGITQTQSAGLRRRALVAEQQAAETESALRAGLLSQVSQWLKQKLVRKLIADRAQLLEAQEEAARKALRVDERLNRIERQIQQQNHAYEKRIEELNRQLVAAKEENRELIRNRIAQIKQEMERARIQLLARAQDENEGVES